jgi:site-specific recombinase XerD
MTNLTLEAACCQCQHYLLAKKRENCSESNIALCDNWLTRWREFLKEGFSESLGDLTLAHGRRFSDHLHGIGERFVSHPCADPKEGGLSCHTIHQAIRILRSLGSWLSRNEYIETHVFQDLELPQLKKRVIEVLTEDEIRAILTSIDGATVLGARDYALVVLGLDTGILQGEMCGLRLRAVDWDRRLMKVNGKGDKERIVPLGALAEAALRWYVDIYCPQPYYSDEN